MTPEEHRRLINIEQKTGNIEALLIALIEGSIICWLIWVFS